MDDKNKFTLFSEGSLAPLIDESDGHWVLVLCTADWLGSAHILEEFICSILEKNGNGEEVSLYKVDTEENDNVTQQLNVRQLPTVAILKDREFIDYFSGLMNKRKLHKKFLALGIIHE